MRNKRSTKIIACQCTGQLLNLDTLKILYGEEWNKRNLYIRYGGVELTILALVVFAGFQSFYSLNKITDRHEWIKFRPRPSCLLFRAEFLTDIITYYHGSPRMNIRELRNHLSGVYDMKLANQVRKRDSLNIDKTPRSFTSISKKKLPTLHMYEYSIYISSLNEVFFC
jgi:hypothetical protein